MPAPRLPILALALVGCHATPYREAEVSETPVVPAPAAQPAGQSRVLRFSVAAMESPRDTYAAYSRLFEAVGRRLGARTELVQRRTYREVNDLLTSGQIDAALICTGGFLDLRARGAQDVEPLAVPVVDGRSTYESLIIVPARSSAQSLDDLAGKRFAFTDELSFSGRAWVVHLLRQRGRTPEDHFGGTVFTHSHDRSVSAVAKGIVDGAAVHSLIYGQLLGRDPSLADQTRVIMRSPPFGMMPVVASARMPEAERQRLRAALLDLERDPEVGPLLHTLRIDRFDRPPPGLYDSAAAVVEIRR